MIILTLCGQIYFGMAISQYFQDKKDLANTYETTNHLTNLELDHPEQGRMVTRFSYTFSESSFFGLYAKGYSFPNWTIFGLLLS